MRPDDFMQFSDREFIKVKTNLNINPQPVQKYNYDEFTVLSATIYLLTSEHITM